MMVVFVFQSYAFSPFMLENEGQDSQSVTFRRPFNLHFSNGNSPISVSLIQPQLWNENGALYSVVCPALPGTDNLSVSLTEALPLCYWWPECLETWDLPLPWTHTHTYTHTVSPTPSQYAVPSHGDLALWNVCVSVWRKQILLSRVLRSSSRRSHKKVWIQAKGWLCHFLCVLHHLLFKIFSSYEMTSSTFIAAFIAE